MTAELAFLTRALKAPTLRRPFPGWPNAPAASPGRTRSSSPRACNGRSPRGSPTAARVGSAPPGSRPERPRGVRLRPRPRSQTRSSRPPRDPGFHRRQAERGVPRTTRHRQDPFGHRHRDPRVPSRAPAGLAEFRDRAPGSRRPCCVGSGEQHQPAQHPGGHPHCRKATAGDHAARRCGQWPRGRLSKKTLVRHHDTVLGGQAVARGDQAPPAVTSGTAQATTPISCRCVSSTG